MVTMSAKLKWTEKHVEYEASSGERRYIISQISPRAAEGPRSVPEHWAVVLVVGDDVVAEGFAPMLTDAKQMAEHWELEGDLG